MTNQLNSYGMKLMVSVWPHVSPSSENFVTMNTTGLLTHDANGSSLVTSGNVYIPDQYNPLTRQFIWDKIKRHYYDYGIKVYWLDADEPERSKPGLQWWYGRHDDEIAMVWTKEHHQMIWDGLKEQREQEIIMLTSVDKHGSEVIE